MIMMSRKAAGSWRRSTSPVNKYWAAAPSGSSDEEMAAYLYQYVIEHAEYESNERDQQMDSFFLQGKSVCAGYSKAYQYLMEKAGIPCTTLSGHLLAATGSRTE